MTEQEQEQAPATEDAGTSGHGQHVGEAGQPAADAQASVGASEAAQAEPTADDQGGEDDVSEHAQAATSERDQELDPGSGGEGTAEDNAAPGAES